MGLLVLQPSISSLLQSVKSFVTNYDSLFYYKGRQRFYYKVQQVLLQSVTILLQSATIITKCGRTDFESTYNILLDDVNCVSRHNRHIHNTLILPYKSLFLTKYLIYSKIMFNLSFTSYNLRGNYILTLPVPNELLLMAFILFLIMPLNNGTYYQTRCVPVILPSKKQL